MVSSLSSVYIEARAESAIRTRYQGIASNHPTTSRAEPSDTHRVLIPQSRKTVVQFRLQGATLSRLQPHEMKIPHRRALESCRKARPAETTKSNNATRYDWFQ